MPRTKILYVSHSPFLYGAESCLATLIQYLDSEAFEPVVIVPAEGPLKERLDALGVKSYFYKAEWWAKNEDRISFGESGNIARIQELVEIINQEKPDIVHSNTSVIWDGAVAAMITGTRHVWHIHEILRGQPSITALLPLPLLYKTIELCSEKVVAVSSEVRGELAEFINPAKMLVIHNGIDATRFESASDRSFREEMGFGENAIVALTVASIKKGKGIDNLIEAAAKVRQRGGDVNFVIAGKGSSEAVAELKNKVDRHQLTEHVHFLGHRTDVPRLLAGADLFVLPSLKEAFPLVVLEAMASGKPVVATDCGGTTEMIVDGASGFVVPVNDPGALAEKILEIATAPERMNAMGESALKRFNEHYRADIYAQNFAALYREVLKEEKQTRLFGKELVLFYGFLEAYQNYIDVMRAVTERDHQLSQCNLLVTEREKRLAELNLSLTNRDEQLQQRDSQLAERGSKIEQLSQWLSDRERDVRNHSQWLEERNRSLEEQNRRLAECNQANKSLDLLLAERSQEILLLNQGVTDRDQQIQKGMEQIALSEERRNQEISLLNQALTDRDQQIQKGMEQIALSEERRVELENRLRGKRLALSDKDDRIEHVEGELLQERQRMEGFQDLTGKKLAHLENELEQGDQRLNSMKSELTRLAEEKEAERRRLEAMVDERELRIHDMMNSKSWKITAPLRKTLDILRKK